jgi:hypothetical protein
MLARKKRTRDGCDTIEPVELTERGSDGIRGACVRVAGQTRRDAGLECRPADVDGAAELVHDSRQHTIL